MGVKDGVEKVGKDDVLEKDTVLLEEVTDAVVLVTPPVGVLMGGGTTMLVGDTVGVSVVFTWVVVGGGFTWTVIVMTATVGAVIKTVLGVVMTDTVGIVLVSKTVPVVVTGTVRVWVLVVVTVVNAWAVTVVVTGRVIGFLTD